MNDNSPNDAGQAAIRQIELIKAHVLRPEFEAYRATTQEMKAKVYDCLVDILYPSGSTS